MQCRPEHGFGNDGDQLGLGRQGRLSRYDGGGVRLVGDMGWRFWRSGHDGEDSLAFGLTGILTLWDNGGALMLRAMVPYEGQGQLCAEAFGLYW